MLVNLLHVIKANSYENQHIKVLVVIFLLSGTTILAQDTCSDYLLLHDKVHYEILTFNQKDKQTGKIAYYCKWFAFSLKLNKITT